MKTARSFAFHLIDLISWGAMFFLIVHWNDHDRWSSMPGLYAVLAVVAFVAVYNGQRNTEEGAK